MNKYADCYRKHFASRPGADAKLIALLTFGVVAVALVCMMLVDLVRGMPFKLFATYPADEVPVFLGIILPALFVPIMFVIWRTSEEKLTYAIFPLALAGAVMTALSGYLVQDFDLLGQIFYFMPVVAGAYCLPRVGAFIAWVLVAVLHGVTVVLFSNSSHADIDYVAIHVALFSMVLTIGWAQDSQQRSQELLQQQAALDSLTGLLTRQELTTVLPTSPRDADGAGTALLAIDIDHFKSVNDQHGHPFGDTVLVRVAHAIKQLSDLVGARAYRFGGDELMVLAPQKTLAEAEHLAENIVQEINAIQFATLQGTTVNVTVSIGVGHWPEHANMHNDLYQIADAALYNAKRNGRNQACSDAEAHTSSHEKVAVKLVNDPTTGG